MLVPYQTLSDTARVWIYQSNRLLDKQECAEIDLALSAFAEEWVSHGNPVKAFAEVKHACFIVLLADTDTSGCSIDSSTRLVKSIEQQYGIRLFDRMQLAYRTASNTPVAFAAPASIAQQLKNGQLPPEARVFDNTIQTKSELEQKWEVPFEASWAGR